MKLPIGSSGAVAVSKPKPPAPGQETTDAAEASDATETRVASRKSEHYLPTVKMDETLRELNGSSAEWLRRSLIEKSAGKTFSFKRRSFRNSTA